MQKMKMGFVTELNTDRFWVKSEEIASIDWDIKALVRRLNAKTDYYRYNLQKDNH